MNDMQIFISLTCSCDCSSW